MRKIFTKLSGDTWEKPILFKPSYCYL